MSESTEHNGSGNAEKRPEINIPAYLAWFPTGAWFLVASGLQVSGWTSVPIAIACWVMAALMLAWSGWYYVRQKRGEVSMTPNGLIVIGGIGSAVFAIIAAIGLVWGHFSNKAAAATPQSPPTQVVAPINASAAAPPPPAHDGDVSVSGNVAGGDARGSGSIGGNANIQAGPGGDVNLGPGDYRAGNAENGGKGGDLNIQGGKSKSEQTNKTTGDCSPIITGNGSTSNPDCRKYYKAPPKSDNDFYIGNTSVAKYCGTQREPSRKLPGVFCMSGTGTMGRFTDLEFRGRLFHCDFGQAMDAINWSNDGISCKDIGPAP